MAPTERPKLPFRWEFVPTEDPKDKSVRWSWRAHTQAGALAMQSEGSFETLTDCMLDARAAGYGQL